MNTAAAWLLQTPIQDVPDAIRAQAKLLREGLAQGTIKKVIVAYAHNALESQNVENELKAVRHLLNGLEAVKGVEVEVIELGLRQIEALYLTSVGSIQIVDEFDLDVGHVISETGPGWRAYVFSLKGDVLFGLYDITGMLCSAPTSATSWVRAEYPAT